jgi:hypothetical protein
MSAQEVEVYNEFFPDKDTIDLGMCLVNDSLFTSFMIKNNSGVKLVLGDQTPSYVLQIRQGNLDEFVPNKLPSTFWDFLAGTTRQYTLKYYALNYFPLGRKTVTLRIGLYDPAVISDPQNDEDLTFFKDFVITCLKTDKFIDCYDKTVFFDSVYVNPIDTIRYFWKLVNTSKNFLQIEEQRFKMLSPIPVDTEITVVQRTEPVDFPSNKTTKEWQINYYPLDKLQDSATFQVMYKPEPVAQPEKWDSVSVKIYGTGVEQKLTLFDSDYDFRNDTIFIGDVRVGAKATIKGIMLNEGNIPFGSIAQDILNIEDNEPSAHFSLIKGLNSHNAHIRPQSTDTFSFDFSPKDIGTITARFVIKSDLAGRKIRGVPKSALTRTIYITGRGIEARINTVSREIDFGSIVIHPECPTSSDTSVFIANNGNAELVISAIELEPSPPSPFEITPQTLTIMPYSQELVNIKFSTEAQPVGVEFNWKMNIISNAKIGNDTFAITLKAMGIEPMPMLVSIPKAKAKPGTRIALPILVEKDKINYSSEFSTDLLYDNTLLRYINYSKLSTAAENAQTPLIFETTSEGKLSIQLKMPNVAEMNFLPKDTLILLYFDSYLGSQLSTPVSIINPVFGDGICSKVLTPVITNGTFTLDSVCGLSWKAVPHPEADFVFEKIYPNPASDEIEFEFTQPVERLARVVIFNNYGEEIMELVDKILKKGDYSYKADLTGLPSGTYFCVYTCGIFKKSILFTVTK